MIKRMTERTIQHGASMALRESRLRNPALTFLVAASAAFFVGARAGAIEITQMIPYQHLYEVDEFTLNPVYVTTDSDFARVEWSVEGAKNNPVWTDHGTENGDDPDTSSNYSPSFEGLGGFIGTNRTVTATAYDANGNSDSHEIEIKVWGSHHKIWILDMEGPSDVVEREQFTVTIRTTPGFDRVEWLVDDVLVETDDTRPSFWESSFTHSFPKDSGDDDENGEPHTITAVAYPIGSASSTERPLSINVHGGKGKLLRDVISSVDGYYKSGLTIYASTSHRIRYYHDETVNPKIPIYATLSWHIDNVIHPDFPVHGNFTESLDLGYDIDGAFHTIYEGVGLDEDGLYHASTFTSTNAAYWDGLWPGSSGYSGIDEGRKWLRNDLLGMPDGSVPSE